MHDLPGKDFLEDVNSIINEKENLILFDQTDKPFLLFYLIIFILGIILTLMAI